MIVYGKQIVFSILEKYPEIINEIYLAKECDKKIFSKFAKLNKKIIRPDSKKAQALAHGGNHQGFLLDIDEFSFVSFQKIKESRFIVILDGLTDIGNIGAIVRTSFALGVDSIIISGVKNINMAGVIRTSASAALDIPICLIPNSADVANELKQIDFKLIGANMDGIDIKQFQPISQDKYALFLGSEGRGLSNKIIKKLDHTVSIKMYNDFDSLNVSVAAGILIHSLV